MCLRTIHYCSSNRTVTLTARPAWSYYVLIKKMQIYILMGGLGQQDDIPGAGLLKYIMRRKILNCKHLWKVVIGWLVTVYLPSSFFINRFMMISNDLMKLFKWAVPDYGWFFFLMEHLKLCRSDGFTLNSAELRPLDSISQAQTFKQGHIQELCVCVFSLTTCWSLLELLADYRKQQTNRTYHYLTVRL